MSTTLAPLLTPKEAAELIGTTEGNLAQWRHHKRYGLSFVKIGRNFVRYRREDVQKFIASYVVGKAEAPTPKRRKRAA